MMPGGHNEAPIGWDAFIANHPSASIYHLSGWANLLRDVFGHETNWLTTRSNESKCGVITGGLPLVRIKSRLFGDMLVSLPFCNWGGPIAINETCVLQLIEKAQKLMYSTGADFLELRTDHEIATDMSPRTHKVRMALALPGDEDAFRRSLKAKVRSQINRPLKEGAVAQVGGADDLARFYAVFSRNMRDLGTPVLPKSFFEAVFKNFPGIAHVVSVSIDNRPVAVALLIENGKSMEIPWASSLREANRFGVNMLLYWECIRFAISRGLTQFDFGRSTVDSGTYRFKKQWGARPEQLYWYGKARQGTAGAESISPDNPKYRIAIRTWQRLPVWLANRIGPMLSRSLP